MKPSISWGGDSRMKRIGIPRSFYYHQYPCLWETLFLELGYEPVVSGPSTRDTVTIAASVSEAEHCLPNKLFDGHVVRLRDQVDLLFIPRIISMVKGHIACPKFGALPEATRDGVARDMQVLSIDIDESREPLKRTLIRLGKMMGAGAPKARGAVNAALDAMGKCENERLRNEIAEDGAQRFLILGHPYTLWDNFIADPIFSKLRKLGVRGERVTFENRNMRPGEILWCSFRTMHERLLNLDESRFDGVIQISTFNCGADSMMTERFRRLCAHKSIPYMVIMVDEHTGRAGIDTRLEAFVDSLAWKRRRDG